MTHRDPSEHTSFIVRLWAEDDTRRRVVRGFIQDIRTGHRTYFGDLDLPVGLLRERAARLTGDSAPLE